jgi:hypothetical protein
MAVTEDHETVRHHTSLAVRWGALRQLGVYAA